MAHREVYGRVLRPLCLPGGYPLHPGQSIDVPEMASLGEERLGKLVESGAIELRTRRRADATGLLDISSLNDAIESEQRELEAFAKVVAKAIGTPGGITQGVAPPPAETGAVHAGGWSENLDAVPRSLFASAEAHNGLRREFDALVARLLERDVRG